MKTRVGLGKVKGFFEDSWSELQKVVWPNTEQVSRFTVVVMITVIAVGFFLWVWDTLLAGLTGRLFR
jgi:preprotein translocase subunit SecE